MLSRENPPTLFRSFSAATFAALLLAGAPAQAQNCPTGDNTDDQYILGEVDGQASAMHWPTGLVWKRCSEGQTFESGECTGTPQAKRWNTWTEMDRLLPTSFANQTSWGIGAGFSQNLLESGGWRMAYRNELWKITEICGNSPKVNRTVFPNTPSWYVWSGSPYAGDSSGAWRVYFGNGNAHYGDRSYSYPVRLVRGGQSFDSLVAPAAQDAAPRNTATFPAFTLSASLPAGQAWGGARITGDGCPAFQINGTGGWVREAIVKSGDQITVRLTTLGTVGASRTATFTLRSGQTTGTSADAANGGNEATVLQETSASFTVNTVLPVAGVCGTADGVATLAAPSASLCSAGTTSAVDGSAADAFTWSCLGQHGGADSGQCSAPRQYAVTPSAGANGTISPTTAQNVTYNQPASFTVTPDTGYTASVGGTCPAGSWSGDVYTTGAITEACTVEASFTAVPPPTYDVTATASPAVGGNVVCTPSSVPAGESSICTATAHAGYSFADWGGDCSGTDPVCTLSGITAARSVTANFTADTGTCTGDNASANYIVGEAAGQAVAMHWTSGLVWKRCSEGQSWNAAVQTCEGTTETRRWNEWLDEYMPRSFEGQDAWWGTVGAPPYTPDPAAGPVGVDRLRDGQWRMAYRLELAGLTTGCEDGPKINREVFPATPSWYVWSGSPFAYNSGGAWSVHFYDGYANDNDRSDDGHVRLVRGGQSFDSLTSPSALTVSAGDSVTFPAFTLAPSVPTGEAWGGARISGDGNPEFQLNGTGDWVQQAIVKSGDQIAVRFNAPDSGSRTVTFTLRSGQTTGTNANASNGGNEATALQETSASFTVNAFIPVSGVCGTADGVATLAAPSASLCSAGTASAVDGSAADAFTWTCLGQHGGADSGQCSAPRQYAVTPSAGANGTISPDTVQSVTYNQPTSFTVIPATGYSASVGGTCPVGGWSGSTWTTGAIIEACTVEASFTEIPPPPPPPPPPVVTYTVTAASPAAGGTASCTPLIVSSGETSTCTAAANTGYRFTGWSGDCTGTETSCTLTDITVDRSVTASFASRTELELPLPEGTQSGQTLRVVATGGEWYFDEAHTRTHTGASVGEALPAGVTLPHGVVSLRLIGGTPGSSATVVLTYPEALPAGTRYYKYGPTAANPVAHWYEYPHAEISGNTITLTLTDGGAGDSDLSENGVIVDPGGPAQVAPDVTPIPTLSQWATLLLAGLMGLLAFGRLRRLPHA